MGIVQKYGAVTNNGGTSATINVPFPTANAGGANALQAEDFMLLTIAHNGGSNNGGGIVTCPAGWVPVNGYYPMQTNSSQTSGAMAQFRRIAKLSDLISGSVNVAISYSNDWAAAHLQTFSGVDPNNPIAGYGVANGGSTSQKYVAPTPVTPLVAGCLSVIASMCSNSGDVAAAGVPTGYAISTYFYPSTSPNANLHESIVGVMSAPTTGVAALADYFTWEGQYSNFALQSLITVLQPEIPEPVLLISSEYTKSASAILSSVVETATTSPAYAAITYAQWLQYLMALFCGLDSGASGTAPIFTDLSGTKNRIQGTLNSNNDRTAVALTSS